MLMKKLLFCIACLLGSLIQVQAQEDNGKVIVAVDSTVASTPAIKFGYLSYDLALRQMPDYAIARQKVADLRTSFDAEAKRVEDEFNKKYEAFLEGQREFPRTILLKRQTELQELMQKNIAFKEQARRELQKAEADAMAPLKDSLKTVLALLVEERGYAFILNTDANAFPAISPTMGEDVNDVVLQMLSNGESAK